MSLNRFVKRSSSGIDQSPPVIQLQSLLLFESIINNHVTYQVITSPFMKSGHPLVKITLDSSNETIQVNKYKIIKLNYFRVFCIPLDVWTIPFGRGNKSDFISFIRYDCLSTLNWNLMRCRQITLLFIIIKGISLNHTHSS